MTHEIG